MIGWIADTIRLFWSLVYWNARKTIFRLRHGRSPCPCQSPSDSGRALETRCDAALLWNQPARFQRVCPLLKPDATGRLVCSVDAADVRPFWGRAVMFYGVLLAALYLGAALAFFGIQRGLGKPLSFHQVVWPPAWKEYSKVQSRYFAEKAQRALTAKNINEGIVSLSLAYELDPQNYPAGFMLAQLWQIGQPALADRLYAQLSRGHPEQRAFTLAAWYQSLLMRGDFDGIIRLGTDALKVDDAHADAWLNALLFALHRDDDPVAAQAFANNNNLPPAARALFALDLRTRQLAPADSRNLLLRSAPSITYSYFDYYRPRRLIELGFPREALQLLQQPGSRLSDRDKVVLWLDANAALGWSDAGRTEVQRLLANSFNPSLVELLCAHLIRRPDPWLFATLFARVRATPLPLNQTNYKAHVSLLCAAGANDELGELHELIERLKQLVGSRFQALDAVETFFRTQGDSARIETCLPALQPLPIDITYALLEKYHRPWATTKTSSGKSP